MSVHSDWGDWLPEEIHQATPEGMSLWYLGCNGFVIKTSGGVTVFIDPYLGTGDPPRTVRMIPIPFDPADIQQAQAVLATHEHSDHVHGPSQAPLLADTGGNFYGPDASVQVLHDEEWFSRWDLSESAVETVAVGDQLEIGDLTITVGPANDPDAVDPVSYLIEHETGTFFHGGDARPGSFESLGQQYDIDLGALAFGTTGMIPDKQTGEPAETTWYNDETMLIEAARELELDGLIPTHWDMWKGLTADPTALHHHTGTFEYPRRLEIVEIGDRIELSA